MRRRFIHIIFVTSNVDRIGKTAIIRRRIPAHRMSSPSCHPIPNPKWYNATIATKEIPMGKVIPVVNQKGGVAKSTTVVNLSHALASKGKRVLAIDADPQASLTIYFGQDPRHLEENQQTLYHGLLKNKSLSELVIPGNPALIPASIMLSKADPELMSEPSSSWVLKEKLNGLRDEYDFILIDCPPTLTLLTLNALSAGNLAIIPAKTDNLSVMGIPLLLETIHKIQKRGNSQLRVFGILPTLYHARNVHDQ